MKKGIFIKFIVYAMYAVSCLSYMQVHGYDCGPDYTGDGCSSYEEEEFTPTDSNTNDSSEDGDATESSNNNEQADSEAKENNEHINSEAAHDDKRPTQEEQATEATTSEDKESKEEESIVADEDKEALEQEEPITSEENSKASTQTEDEDSESAHQNKDDEDSKKASTQTEEENSEAETPTSKTEDDETPEDEESEAINSETIDESTATEAEKHDDELQHAQATQPWWTPGATTGVPILPAYADLWVKACPDNEVIIDINNNHELILYPSLNSELSESEDGDLIYKAQQDFQGVDTFTYKLKDKSYIVKVTVKDDDRCQAQEEAIQVPPAACQVYAVHDEKRSDSQFLTIDPNGYTTVALGSMHEQHDIEGIAIEPKTHTLYAISGGSSPEDGNLYLVNPLTSELTVVGNTGFSEVTDLAFHPDSTLWAWSEKIGLIHIDPKSADSALYFASKLNVEGLAWDTEGQLLYASEGQNLWVFDDKEQSLNLVCDNFAGEVESLDTLAGGLLLFSVNDDESNTIFVYEPATCSILLDRRFETKTGYTDIEAISWPLDCQVSEDVPAWQAHFHGETDNELVCLQEPRWLTVSGYMNVDPSDKHLYLETFWQLTDEKEKICSELDDFSKAPKGRCTHMHYPKQLVTDASAFNIKVWWPGLPQKTDDDTIISVKYGLNVLDLNGDPLPLGRISKQLIGSHSLCAVKHCEDEAECEMTCVGADCDEERLCEDEDCEAICDDDDCSVSEEDAEKVCEDEDCLADETICDDDDCPVLEDPETEALEFSQPIDIDAIQDYLHDEQFLLEDNGQLLVWFEDQWHIFMFAEQLADDVAIEGTLELELIEDVNEDGYRDYAIIYPDGQVQLLYYLGIAESVTPIDEVLDDSEEELDSEDESQLEAEIEDTEEESQSDAEAEAEVEDTEEVEGESQSDVEAEDTEAEEESQPEAKETEADKEATESEVETDIEEEDDEAAQPSIDEAQDNNDETDVVKQPSEANTAKQDDTEQQEDAKQPERPTQDKSEQPKDTQPEKPAKADKDDPPQTGNSNVETPVQPASQVETTVESAPVVILPEPAPMVSPPAEPVSTVATTVVETPVVATEVE